MKRITEQAHDAVRAVVRAGETVVDATVGNGHDTVFLARLVGPEGVVFGWDIQEAALAAARLRLKDEGLNKQVRLVHGNHADPRGVLGEGGNIAAVMFNLGYLPGGDHAIVTEAATTLEALAALEGLVRPGGVITVVCYRGHPGGAREAEAVCTWAENAEAHGWRVQVAGRNDTEDGPFLLVLRRLERGRDKGC